MNWRLGFVVTAAACAVLPLVVPQHSLTILVEALILGLFAMSLDLLVGYYPAVLVRARRRLWSGRLFLRAHSDIRAAAAAGGDPALRWR